MGNVVLRVGGKHYFLIRAVDLYTTESDIKIVVQVVDSKAFVIRQWIHDFVYYLTD